MAFKVLDGLLELRHGDYVTLQMQDGGKITALLIQDAAGWHFMSSAAKPIFSLTMADTLEKEGLSR